MSRFKKRRATITDDKAAKVGGLLPCVSPRSVRCVPKADCLKSIASCSASTFTWPEATKRCRGYLERSTTGIGEDCRQLKVLQQPRCCWRPRRCDTLRLGLQSEVTPRSVASHHVCYPPLRDPCVSRCYSGYWRWDNNGKYGMTAGNALHAHAYCTGNAGYYCPNLNAIDNWRTGHCHWNDSRSVWNDGRHYGRS